MYSVSDSSPTNVSTSTTQEQNCRAVDEKTGDVCGETEGLRILDEFRKLYEGRIEKVDKESEFEADRTSAKLQIMREWIKDLGEQNVMLVRTVEDLEQAACSRVKVLEEKLRQSSRIVTDSMAKSSRAEESLSMLTSHINQLENDSQHLQGKIEYLRSDIRGLLELIRRAQCENSWTTDGIQFFEIRADDILAPPDCSSNQDDLDGDKVHSLSQQIKQFRENETKMLSYQRDLKTKLSELTIQLSEKEEVIKQHVQNVQYLSDKLKKRSTLPNQVILDTACAGSDCDDLYPTRALQMQYPMAHYNMLEFSNKDKIVSCLMDTKLLMERQSVNLCDLKMVLAQILERENAETAQCRTNLSESCADDIAEILNKNIDNIDKMCSEKNTAISVIDSIVKDCHDIHVSEAHGACNTMLSAVMIQHLRFMQEFRFCTVEAQAATEDIRDEIDSVVATFNSRHQKYMDLANTVTSVQDQLIETQETLLETINRLELRHDEQTKHSERIVNGEKKLKDLKNNINRVQSDLERCVNSMQDYNVQNRTEVYMYNHLLILVVEEVDEVINNLQAFQAQGRCTTSVLAELKRQLSVIEFTLKEVQIKTENALLENNLAKSTFSEREKRLAKLEAEVDSAHTKMQDMVEIFEATKKGSVPNYFSNNQAQCQFISDILKTKEDLRNTKKECHNYKLQTLQRSYDVKYSESINQWKCRITDLEDQIKVLEHEAKCKEETISFLKHSIESLKKELLSVQTKSENHRRCHIIDKLDLKQKILSLESTVKAQTEVEGNLRISLRNSEMELEKSRKEHLDSHLTECDSETLLVQSAYPTNISQVFKLLQDTIQSTKGGLQELRANLKKIIFQDSSSNHVPTNPVMTIIGTVEKYEENLDICSQEIEKLKSALRSKDKLLEHRDERIKIQRGSIEMMQLELKELNEKSQKRIDMEALLLKYEKEKKDLTKQNELQNQTIRHLQDAVVEAKKSLDQKAQKGVSDVSDRWSSLTPSTFNHGNVHDV